VRIHLKDGASIVINNLPSKKEADDFISWLAEQIDSDVQSKEQ
jgi:hypothetical protein